MAECDICYNSFEQWYKVSGYGCCSGLFCVSCKKNLNRCPYCRTDITVEKEINDILWEKQEKYFDLVWFARSPNEYDEHWQDIPEPIKQATIMAQDRIIQEYSDEVDKLQSAFEGDWYQGFNSGMLAALRYVRTILDPEEGIMEAESQFPMLDT